MPHTAVDVIVIIFILLSAVMAFIRGFAREALTLGTLCLAAWLAMTQYELAVPYIEPYLHKKDHQQLLDFASGCAIFILVMAILFPINLYIRSFIKGEHITSIDRSFGFVFGAARGYLLLAFIYLIMSWLLPEEKQPTWLKEANTKPILVYGANLVKDVIPQEQRDFIQQKAKETNAEDGKDAQEGNVPLKEKEAPHNDILHNVIEGVKAVPEK